MDKDVTERIAELAKELQKALAEYAENRAPWCAIVTPEAVYLRQD